MSRIKEEVSESDSYTSESETQIPETPKDVTKGKLSIRKELQAPKEKKRPQYSYSDDDRSEYENVSTKRSKRTSSRKKDNQSTSAEALLDSFKKLFNCSSRSNTEWTFDSISDDVDVFMVSMPKSLDPELLVNTSIFFNGKKKIKVGEQSYKWKLDDKNTEPISVVASSNSSECGLMHLRTNGTFEVTEVIKNATEGDEYDSFFNGDEENVEEHSKLKKRHQFFCLDFAGLKLDKDVGSKLKMIDTCVEKKSRKHKNKLKLLDDTGASFNGEGLNNVVKRKKMRRQFQEAVSAVENEDIYNLLIPRHKKRF